MGARETALNALIACRKDGAWSNGVLKDYIQRTAWIPETPDWPPDFATVSFRIRRSWIFI